MRTLAAALLLTLAGALAGPALAQTADEIDPNDSKSFYDQMDREGRGGSSNQ